MGSGRPGSGSDGDAAEGETGDASGHRVILLTPEEVAVLLRCCLRYRGSIPFYLQSAKAEYDTISSVVKKLEGSADGRD
ncbi:MAG TPA: hypothetical protein VEP66_15780 [Myxococcales bacterium]|nr:hypothetical protein [Myxococcales bacterium]